MLLTSKVLKVPHAFSTREGGVSQGPFESLNLGRSVGDDSEAVAQNARRLAGAVGLTAGQLVSANQVHGDTFLEVSGAQPGEASPRAIGDADGLVSCARGVALGIRTADCVPVLIWAPDVQAIAAAHAGWRGAVVGIAGKAVHELATRYRAQPGRMVAAIGPSIRRCCFEVGEDVAANFKDRFGEAIVTRSADGRPHVDLTLACRQALLEAGVESPNIDLLDGCTCCDSKRFFSHRRDKGRSGRHLSFVCLP
jgi:YfiH family protein